MANKINLVQVANQVASISGCSQSTAETFVKTTFSMLSDLLQNGTKVKIKGIGTFKKIDNGSIEVRFDADKQLSDFVNMPFSSFEAVELDDAVTDELFEEEMSQENEEIEQIESNVMAEENSDVVASQEESINTETSDVVGANIDSSKTESESEKQVASIESQVLSDESDVDVLENNTDESSVNNNDIDSSNNEEVNDIEEQDKEKTEVKVLSSQRGHITLSFYIISIFIALVIGGVIGYYVKSISEDNTINNRIDRQQEQLDSIRASIVSNQNDTTINESTTQNNDDVKYDTITPYRLITTMAEEYYGDMNFWTYIYEENKEILGHPERIPSGTILKIPSAEKYEIDSANPTSVQNAKLKGVEIYNKFRK